MNERSLNNDMGSGQAAARGKTGFWALFRIGSLRAACHEEPDDMSQRRKMHEPILSAAEVGAYLDEVFPQVRDGATIIESIGPMVAVMRMPFSERNLRPGGTLSGPSMMALADYAMYAVILGHIGRVALAVTTNLNINFLRKPGPADIFAEARLLKLGKRLAVGEVLITQDGLDGPVAHVTSTYSIPPRD
jgi:uncharacterized protein (TIGR00369 family)